MKKEIAEIKKTNQLLKDDLSETKAAIEEQEHEKTKQNLSFRDEKRSSYFLGLVQNNIKGQITEVNKFASGFDKNIEALAPKMENQNNLDRYKIDIQQMCQEMQDSLNELLQEQPNNEKIENGKKNVGSRLSTLLETLPPSVFLKLMQEQVEKDIFSFKTGKSIPPFLQQDGIEKLDYAPEEVQPLQKLLYNAAWAYADCRSRAKKTQLKALSLEGELQRVKAEATELVRNHFSGDSHKLKAALNTMESNIKAACEEATIAVLKKHHDELENFCAQHETNRAEVVKQIENIERNSRLSEHLSTLIFTLARKHSKFPKLIEETTNRLQSIVKEDLTVSFNVLLNEISKSRDGLEKEFELYTQLRPSQLFTVTLDKYFTIPLYLFSSLYLLSYFISILK